MGQSAWSPWSAVNWMGNFMFGWLDDNAKGVQCASCFETEHRLFKVPCGHSFCRDCVRGIFIAALNDSSAMPVKCCGKRVDQRLRRAVLNLEECDRFEAALEESEATNKMFWYIRTNLHIIKYKFCCTCTKILLTIFIITAIKALGRTARPFTTWTRQHKVALDAFYASTAICLSVPTVAVNMLT